jgi:ribosomal protein S18 acetylase RimI-like enzyme
MIHPTPGQIAIQSFEERYAGNFEKLNRIWLENYNLLEESDLPYLNSPYESIIAPGGQIFFAIDNWQVIGTSAAIKRGKNIEVAKLAVESSYQRKGVGRILTETVLEYARSISAEKVFLVSNSRLTPALKLYETLGFEYASLPDRTAYESADVYMELKL